MVKKKQKKTRAKKRSSKKIKKRTKVKKKYLKKFKRRSKIKKKFSKKRNKSRKDNSNHTPELIIKTKPEWIKQALANKAQYQKKYSDSIKMNDGFWKKEGKRISWIKPYKKIKDIKYSSKDVKIKWFYDGTLNASANCIDRHL